MSLTLSHWEPQLGSVPQTIECLQMALLSSQDHEDPIFRGPGTIEIRNQTSIHFTMFATPANEADAFSRLSRGLDNPYDIDDRFRLVATDYQGNEWQGGWTTPRFKGMPRIGYLLTGELQSLSTHPNDSWVSRTPGVELVLHADIRPPVAQSMLTVNSIDGLEFERTISAGRNILDVLGSRIECFYLPSRSGTWVTATTSQQLQHPYLETWLCQPLTIMMGRLVYPRLVARNFGDGRAQVWLRPAPLSRVGSPAALASEAVLHDPAKFWQLFATLLTHIANETDAQGHPVFGATAVTRYFEEIIDASRGSRWIACMTLASSAEGLVRMLTSPTKKNLKPDTALKRLVKEGTLEERHQKSWTTVRHAVMHGQLVSPWSTEEDDQRMLDLADLVCRLTTRLLKCP